MNKKPIKKHTKLLIVADAELATLTEKMAKKKAEDAKKDLKDAKKDSKKKADSQDGCGTPKVPKTA